MKYLGAVGAAGTVGRPMPAATSAVQTPQAVVDGAVSRNDAAVRRLLTAQVVQSTSPYRGSVPDQYGLHSAGSAGQVTEVMAAAFVHPQSAFHEDAALLERMGLAAGFLKRSQSPQGNIDLLTTNFNSPPDTGFVVHNVAAAAAIGRLHGAPVIAEALRTFLVRGTPFASSRTSTPHLRSGTDDGIVVDGVES